MSLDPKTKGRAINGANPTPTEDELINLMINGLAAIVGATDQAQAVMGRQAFKQAFDGYVGRKLRVNNAMVGHVDAGARAHTCQLEWELEGERPPNIPPMIHVCGAPRAHAGPCVCRFCGTRENRIALVGVLPPGLAK